MATAARIQRIDMPVRWLLLNIAAVGIWLRIASSLWPRPGEEHCAFSPGDPFYFFFFITPIFACAAVAAFIALGLAFRKAALRPRKWLLFATLSLVAWLGAGVLDLSLGYRYADDAKCPVTSVGAGRDR